MACSPASPVFLLALIFSIGFAFAGPKNEPSSSHARQIKAHMGFLAHDLLMGREAGTKGEALSALYIESQFSGQGLLPGGDAGTYRQTFAVRRSRLNLNSVSFKIHLSDGTQQHFDNGQDIAVFSSKHHAAQSLRGEAVFVGFGIRAPEFEIDDYAQLDVAGKIVVVLGGPPPFLPPVEAAHYGASATQWKTADAMGALGMLVLYTPALEARWPFSRFRSILGRTELAWLGEQGHPPSKGDNVKFRAHLNGVAVEALLQGTNTSLQDLLAQATHGSPQGFPLQSTVELQRKSIHDDSLTVTNVAGLLYGADPGARQELVVVTAHYDHLGLGIPVKGDRIYNGAGDNALGVGVMLNLINRLKTRDAPLRRSVLFLAVSAEEKGLIGSDYFAQHPTLGDFTMVANINIDGGLPFYDFQDVFAFGADHSQLIERLSDAARQMDLRVAPDPFPEQSLYTRSDQYSFIKRGIPGAFLFIGFHGPEGPQQGRYWWDTMMANHSHKPSDDLSRGWNYDYAAKFADLATRFVSEVANGETVPLWYEDSPVGNKFAPHAPKASRVRKRQ